MKELIITEDLCKRILRNQVEILEQLSPTSRPKSEVAPCVYATVALLARMPKPTEHDEGKAVQP